MSTTASPESGKGDAPASPANAKEGVIARMKILRRSLVLVDRGADFGAELIGRLKSLRKGVGGSTRCVLDVRTEDRRTTLEADGADMLWIFAEVVSIDPEVACDRLTRGIRFSVEGTHADWVTLGRPQMKNGMKAIRVKAEPPGGGKEIEDEAVTVVVAAAIGEFACVERVDLRLEEEARMKITIVQ